MRRSTRLVLMLLAASLLGGCVYYNAFYHARTWFNQAESTRKKEDRDKASGGEIKLYQDAIKKSSKVIAEHPNSSYVDDALFIIGKSFYYIQDYPKAERKFRELLSSYPTSEYADEARFFLGKARFNLENYALAREIFSEFVAGHKNNPWRPEAIRLLAESDLGEADSAGALEYYRKYMEEYKSHGEASEVQRKIGEIEFERRDYAGALVSFRAVEALAKDDQSRLKAMYDEGRSLFGLREAELARSGLRPTDANPAGDSTGTAAAGGMADSVKAGLSLFEKLAAKTKDSLFLGNILLRIAEGRYLLGEEREAILLYDEIATLYEKRPQQAEALYRIGLIAQDDWDDLTLAKELYDLAANTQSTDGWRKLALARSADIAKVEKYRSDLATAKPEEADDSRFMLAELYRTTFNRPDSAISEYRSLVDDFPESELAPKSLLAIGWLLENHLRDTATARGYYQRVIDEYPQSDEYAEAIRLLGPVSAAQDSLYADKLYALAEEEYFDRGNADSAIALFGRLVEEYPESRLTPKADFAIAKIKLAEFVPEEKPDDSTYVDSTMILAFKQLAEKYPDSPYGKEAARLSAGEMKPLGATQIVDETPLLPDTSQPVIDTTLASETADTLTEAQKAEEELHKELINTPLITFEKPVTEGPFVYPIAASGLRIETKLTLKIKIDFDGRVTEVVVLKGSKNDDIDREVKKAMLETYFDPIQFDPSKVPGYFIYNYEVKVPEAYK